MHLTFRYFFGKKLWNPWNVANDSPPLQPWCVGPGAKPRSWAPLSRDPRKGIKRV